MSPGCCLQLDVGNSGLKWRLLHDGDVVGRGAVRDDNLASRINAIAADSVDSIWVASVAADPANHELAELLTQRWNLIPWFAVAAQRTKGLINSYAEPWRMGVDRWLAMLAARERCAGRLCVVDAGSALTIDLVDAEGRHEGGLIIPGAALMEGALSRGTELVRFGGVEGASIELGRDTSTAVHHGISLALTAAVDEAMFRAQLTGARPTLILTGGDGVRVSKNLRNKGQYVEDLVFDGLGVLASENIQDCRTVE